MSPTKAHPFYCCEPSAPCEVHLSTTDRMVYLTSKELRDAIRTRAAEEGVSPKDIITKALNTYLGRAKTAQSWVTTNPVDLPAWMADRLKG